MEWWFIMKKYLFLLFLIGVYVLILFNNKDNKTSNVVSYLDKNRDGAISVKINFKDGINSNNLKSYFIHMTKIIIYITYILIGKISKLTVILLIGV